MGVLSGEAERGNREEKAFVALLCLAVQWWDLAGNREALERRQGMNARTESLIQVNESKNGEMDKEMFGQTKWTKELRPHTILAL